MSGDSRRSVRFASRGCMGSVSPGPVCALGRRVIGRLVLPAVLGGLLACPTSASAYFGYVGGFPAIGGEIAVDSQGYVYAFDFNEGRVRKYSPQGELLLAWGNDERGPDEPFPHNSEPGKFDQPSDITTDPAGNVYVADPVNPPGPKVLVSGRADRRELRRGGDG